MSNRTWACVSCGKTYRRPDAPESSVKCAICGRNCEYVHWKIRVPSPKNRKQWDKFWQLYIAEKEQLKRWCESGTVEEIHLDILNMRLMPTENNKR